jgi:rubrerythrin
MTLVGLTKPELTRKLDYDLDLIRSALIAELDAINLYASHLEHLNDETAKKVVEHIIDEEKEHAAELSCLIMRLDKMQEEKMSEVNASTCIAGGFQS